MKVSITSTLALYCALSAASATSNSSTPNKPTTDCLKNELKDISSNISLDPNPPSLSLHLNGYMPIEANATISITLLSHDEEIFNQAFDPCTYAVDGNSATLCPASEGPLEYRSRINISETFAETFSTAVPDTAKLYLNLRSLGGNVSTGCFEQDLDLGGDVGDDDEGDGSQSSSDGASGDEAGASEQGNSTTADSSSDEESSGSIACVVSSQWMGALFLTVSILLAQTWFL